MPARSTAEDRAEHAGGDHQADDHPEEAADLAQEPAPAVRAPRWRPWLILRPPRRSRRAVPPRSWEGQRARRLRRWDRLDRRIEEWPRLRRRGKGRRVAHQPAKR